MGMHAQAKIVGSITPHIPLRLEPDLAPQKHQTMRKTHAKGWPRVRAFVEFSDLGTLTTFAVKIYIAHFAGAHAQPQRGPRAGGSGVLRIAWRCGRLGLHCTGAGVVFSL